MYSVYFIKKLSAPTLPNWLRRPGAKTPFCISELIFKSDLKRNQCMTEEEKDKAYDLEERLIDFAVRIIRMAESLPKTRVGNHVAGQLIRCGTSPAPNYGEAQSAESRADFIHKMKVCLKELRETRVWLLMIVRARLIKPVSKLDSLIQENNELISIFVTSTRTAKKDKKKSL
jgi:four helix bundle protein